MNIKKIYSKDATYQKFEVLKTNRNKRYKYGEFLAEGVRNINEAVKNGWQINSFIYSGEKPLSSWAKNLLTTIPAKINYELTGVLMSELSGKTDTSELLAIIRMKDERQEVGFSENPVVVLFDRPSNKGNLGTLLRSCDAFGVDALIVTGHSVDIYDPDVVGSSMGSFFKVPFVRLSENAEIDAYLKSLKEKFNNFKIIATTSHNRESINSIDLTKPVLFLIGSETDGLNRHLYDICDVEATIPMNALSSASSFNVSCAATVLLYETARQRDFK